MKILRTISDWSAKVVILAFVGGVMSAAVMFWVYAFVYALSNHSIYQ